MMAKLSARRQGAIEELKVARALGGERSHTIGVSAPDVISPPFAIEVKSRHNRMAELAGWWRQAERQCPIGLEPALAIHLPDERLWLFIITLKVAGDWMGVKTDEVH